MELIPDDKRAELLRNGELRKRYARERRGEIDFMPVVKLHIPGTGFVWLLTELDPDEPDIAFGLCDLAAGFPELGSVSLKELASVRDLRGPLVKRDTTFLPNKTLSQYASEARRDQTVLA